MIPSLKRRLTASVIAIFLVGWLVSALVTTLAARVVLLRETDRVLEGILMVAESVGNSLTDELEPLQDVFVRNMTPVEGSSEPGSGTPENPAILRLHDSLQLGSMAVPSINVWVGSIHILAGKDTPAFDRPDAGTPTGRSFDQSVNGTVWRVMYKYSSDANAWYAVGMTRQQAQLDASRLLLQMLLPLAIVIPLTALALYYGIARGLGPLRRLVREIELRRQRSSLQPLSAGDVPQEMLPVVDSLNHLLARLADTLENEKRFTANAAHELQTPLAAISTEVQLCQRLLSDDSSREMMERIRARVERASHSVRQLLVLARLDPQASLATETLSLFELCQEVVSELGHLASERRLELVFKVDESQSISGNREALLILLRNLVSNAFRYTPAGGTVCIASGPGSLTVENDSATVVDLRRLTDRFYRGSGEPAADGSPGTGLGLSIVKRICELHGFPLQMDYRPKQQRFVVTLTFGRGRETWRFSSRGAH